MLQVTNPFWTLAETLRPHSVASDIDAACYLVLLLAAIAFVLNLPSVMREVRQIRIAAPRRVLEDEAATPS